MSERKSNHPAFWRPILSLLVGLLIAGTPPKGNAQAPGDVRITVEDISPADFGQYVDVPVVFENFNSGLYLGGFDFLIEFDTAMVDLYAAYPGLLLNTTCNWETFGYDLPEPGLVRIYGIADGAGPETPSCYLEGESGELAYLKFHVTEDSSYECLAAPLQFVWTSCGSNLVSSVGGDTVYLSNDVYDPYLLLITGDETMPTYRGAPNSCLTGDAVLRLVDYYSGRIEILCNDSIDVRGDINLNGIANEIADYVLFANYFFYGASVFTINPELQIAATDVNADSEVLTIRDFIYLYRIIIGDALPFPKMPTQQPTDTARFIQDKDVKQVIVEYPDSLGAAYLKFLGEFEPALWIVGPEFGYSYHDDTTFVLVYPVNGEKVAFDSTILIFYEGEAELVYAEVGDYRDSQIPTSIEIVEPSYVEITLKDMLWKLPDSAETFPVYLRTDRHDVGGFSFTVSMTDPNIIRFDTINPVASWGEAITDWEFYDYNDLGSHGGLLRVVGLYNLPDPPSFPQPIYPGPDSVLLCNLNAILVDTMIDTLCSYSGKAYVSQGSFSDTQGVSLLWESDDCDWVLRCLLCGDVNGDNFVNISDVVHLICWIFGVCEAPEYLDDCDANCDGLVNISDAVYLVAYIFGGGPAPCEACP